MFEYGIGGQEVPREASESFADIPQNRTLIALKLTDVIDQTPVIVEDLRTIDEVFNFYKPSVSVRLITQANTNINQTFSFVNLSDFSPAGLINNCEFLLMQKEERDSLSELIKNIRTNKQLLRLIETPGVYKVFLDLLLELYKELERINNFQTFETKTEQPSKIFEESNSVLMNFGGFSLIESTISGSVNLNPEKKARKKIFLTEESHKRSREILKQKLQIWIKIISKTNNISEIVQNAESNIQNVSNILNKNLVAILNRSREIEKSYRTINNFFRNVESEKIKNLSIINADLNQLTNLEEPLFIRAIESELKQNFQRVDLRNCYSLLLLPGYLGQDEVVKEWAKIANENKVLLITDFADLDSADEVMDSFQKANHAKSEIIRSNVIMICNWIIARTRNSDLGEVDDMFVPPSSALAGKIYKVLLSQVTAGKKHGGLNDVDGVRFELKKSEISSFEKSGLVPMVNEYGKVMAFSATTLYIGEISGLRVYSVVKVFDYISKVLIDLMNRRAFENFTALTEKDIRNQIIKFLDTITGPDRLIENVKILNFSQDSNAMNFLKLEIIVTPYFPANSFVIKMDGRKEDAHTAEWMIKYSRA